MGWTLDAIQLATTKLKTRRIRLVISVIISSVLFCLLMAVSFTVHGTVKSIEKFRDAGFSNRYIASTYPRQDIYSLTSDPALIKQAQALQKTYQAKKTAEAKRLNVSYDPSQDQLVNDYSKQGGTVELNPQNSEVIKLLASAVKKQHNQLSDLKKIGDAYGAKAYYSSYNLSWNFSSSGPGQTYLQVLKNGKENFSQNGGPNIDSGQVNPEDQFNAFGNQWQLMSPELLKPFLLTNQNFNVGKDGSLPVIAPYSEAEKILGLSKISATASNKSKLNRLKDVRQKSAGYVFNVCYRNSTSSEQIQNAAQIQADIKANKGKADYQLPSLVYDLPAKPCGPVRVVRDTRSAEEKAQTVNQDKFDQEFGKPVAQSQLFKMRIVGLNSSPDQSSGSLSVVGLFETILQSSLGSGWFTPLNSVKANKLVQNDIFQADKQPANYYVEFDKGQQLEKIIKEQDCSFGFSGPNVSQSDFNKQTNKCLKQGKYFTFDSFGSNSVAVDKFQKGFDKIFLIVGGVLALIASLIMMGTVGRIIADSRRETAVFRAIGAKRRDIVQIYISYTLMLAGIIVLFCLVVGYLLSTYINLKYSPSISVDALVAFNISDTTQKFSMTGFYVKDAVYLVGLIIAASLVAASLPLLTNMRRNPIRDMRDER